MVEKGEIPPVVFKIAKKKLAPNFFLKKKLAIKFWRFSVRRTRGFKGGSPVSSSVVVKPKTRTFRIAKKGQVARKK